MILFWTIFHVDRCSYKRDSRTEQSKARRADQVVHTTQPLGTRSSGKSLAETHTCIPLLASAHILVLSQPNESELIVM